MSKGNHMAKVNKMSRATFPFKEHELHKGSTVNPGIERRSGGAFKTTSTEEKYFSGSTDKDLCAAGKSLYNKSLKNVEIDKMGDISMHTR